MTPVEAAASEPPSPNTVDAPLRVLFVCTGNICRSPMAERLLRFQLANRSGRPRPRPFVEVSSAGVQAVVGRPMDEPSAAMLRRLGGAPEGHVAQQVTARQIMAADLVLTASTRQRSFIVRRTPTAMRRTFTLREFARLARSLDEFSDGPRGAIGARSPRQLRERIVAVTEQRGAVDPVGRDADEIRDPYREPLPVLERVAREINDAVAVVASVLR